MFYKLSFAVQKDGKINHFHKTTTDINKLSVLIAGYDTTEKELLLSGAKPDKFVIVSAYKNHNVSEPTETQIFYKI